MQLETMLHNSSLSPLLVKPLYDIKTNIYLQQ